MKEWLKKPAVKHCLFGLGILSFAGSAFLSHNAALNGSSDKAFKSSLLAFCSVGEISLLTLYLICEKESKYPQNLMYMFGAALFIFNLGHNYINEGDLKTIGLNFIKQTMWHSMYTALNLNNPNVKNASIISVDSLLIKGVVTSLISTVAGTLIHKLTSLM